MKELEERTKQARLEDERKEKEFQEKMKAKASEERKKLQATRERATGSCVILNPPFLCFRYPGDRKEM